MQFCITHYFALIASKEINSLDEVHLPSLNLHNFDLNLIEIPNASMPCS